MKTKIFTLLIAIVASFGTMFASVRIGKLNYNLNSSTQTAEVTSNDGQYSGDIVIPAVVSYNDTIYHVIGIGEKAFYWCFELTSVSLPDGITSIGNSAFSDCSLLSSVEIPNNVTFIGNYAFSGCSKLTSLTFPNSVTHIGEGAVSGCINLTNIVVSNNITKIEASTFDNCSRIRSITIPNSVTSIGDNAFANCSRLVSITYSDNLTSIGNNAFMSCSTLSNINLPDKVRRIGNSAFSRCSNVSIAFLPDSLTDVGEYAFNGCTSLTRITLPSCLKNIEVGTFMSCTSLTSITIPDSVKSIAYWAFQYCSNLKSINLGNGITRIGQSAFASCSALESIVIPNSVTTIDDNAFSYCTKLSSVTLPNSVINIGTNIFMGCTSISTPIYNNYAFVYMPSSYSGSYSIPDGIEHIAGYAFKNCNSITSIILPNSVISTGNNPFIDCEGLTSPIYNAHIFVRVPQNFSGYYTIPNGIEIIASGAFYESNISSVNIPNSVKYIGTQAFAYCRYFKSLLLPDGVLNIEAVVTDGCDSLTYISIGSGITNINGTAFANCKNLTTIVCGAIIPPSLGENAFSTNSKLKNIYVPCGSLDGYKMAEQWNQFVDLISNQPLPYSVRGLVKDNIGGIVNVPKESICENQIEAVPAFRYHFVQWNDGNADNPRIIELTQDTTFIAEFAINNNGWCGDDLSWSLIDSILTITGIGNMWYYNSSSDLDTIPWDKHGFHTLIVSENVKSISEEAFDNSEHLRTIVWNVRSYGRGSMSDRPKFPHLKSITFGETVDSIPGFICYGCDNVEHVTIADGAKYIGPSAFVGCHNITSITIPSSVSKIGDNAFYYCPELQTAYFMPATPPELGEVVFDYRLPKVYVPCGTLETYKLAYNNEYIRDSIYYAPSQYTINDSTKGFGYVEIVNNICEPTSLTAIPYTHYKFSQWSDGNTENPRIVVLTQDTAFAAIFVEDDCQLASGNCADSLTWVLSCGKKLIIRGNGAMMEAPWLSEWRDSIEKVVIEEGVTNIVANAFAGCRNLQSVTIPNGITSIGLYSFGKCYNLRHVDIPNSVETIGNTAFYECYKLDSVFIPSSVKSIGYEAFYNCTMLKSLTIEGNAEEGTTINGQAFSKCYYLKFVTMGNVTKLLGAVFEDCRELTTIDIPLSVIELSYSAFWRCNKLTSINVSPNNPSYSSIDGIVFNKDHTSILIYPLGKTSKSYSIPNTVTTIGSSAFTSCVNLTSIEIPNSVIEIKSQAFSGCYNLSAITIPENVNHIGMNAFQGCSQFSSVTSMAIVPPVLEWNSKYNSGVFDTIVKYIPLYVPTESVEAYATADQWKDFGNILPSCTIVSGTCGDNLNWTLACGGTLLISGTGAMNNFSSTSYVPWYNYRDSIKSVIIKEGVTTIGESAFKGLKQLMSVSIPNSVLNIGGNSFENCVELTSINIPISVTSIGYRPFGSCNKLKSVIWNAKNCENANTNSPFQSTINSFIFGEEVECIPSHLCKSLSIDNVIIPNSVTVIGTNAFNSCKNLTAITIPVNVTNIGSGAFKQTSISTVTIEAEVPPVINGDIFDKTIDKQTGNNTFGGTIYVPCGTLDAYKTDNGWSSYKDKITYKQLPYTITTNSSERGDITYPSTICDSLLTAIPNYGYHFVQWNDSVIDNPRIVVITQDTSFTAEFAHNPQITYRFDKAKGRVNGESTLAYDVEGDITFTAVPETGYHFVQWADGIVDNPRTAHITQDTIFEAVFAANMYVLSLSSSDETRGTVSNSSGEYEYLSEVQISAISAQGFAFMQWSDGNKENPRTIQITKDISLIANFIENTTLLSLIVEGKNILIADTMTCFVNDSVVTPNIEAIPFFESTQVVITPLTSMHYGWKTTIKLLASDGTIKEHLLTIVKGGSTTSVRATISARNVATKSGEGELYTDATVSVKCGPETIMDEYGITGYKLKTGGNYVAITLHDESFEEGDVLNIYTTNISNSANDVMDGYLHLYTDAGITPLMTIKEHDVPGLHTAILGSGVNGKKAIYLYRTGNDMNPYVAYMEVVRDNDPRSDSALLIDATIGHKPIEWDGTIGTLYVLPSDDVSSLPITFALSEYATSDVPSGVRHDFTTPLYITVTAERGNRVTYTLQTKTQKCGDSLYWILKRDSTLIIEGSGIMYDYANMPAQWDRSAINAVEFPKGMTTIGAQAFSGCENIQSLTFGSNVKTIGEQAFYNCTGLKEIYNYRETPSTAYSNTFDGIDKFECILHVLSESVNKYRYATGWRDFYYIQTIDANEILEPVDNVIITPGSTTAGIVWPVVTGAVSYELVIRDMSGNVICTLMFNASGQLIGIAFAPNRNRKAQQTQVAGFQFTVSGLDSGTTYSYELTALDENGDSIETLTGTFTTTSEIATGIDAVSNGNFDIPQKILRNGQILIIRGEKTFTLQGQKVK